MLILGLKRIEDDEGFNLKRKSYMYDAKTWFLNSLGTIYHSLCGKMQSFMLEGTIHLNTPTNILSFS
jgi:hypothetical protein